MSGVNPRHRQNVAAPGFIPVEPGLTPGYVKSMVCRHLTSHVCTHFPLKALMARPEKRFPEPGTNARADAQFDAPAPRFPGLAFGLSLGSGHAP